MADIELAGIAARLTRNLWPRLPAAIGDGRPGPCSHNGELVKLNGVGRTSM